MNQFEVLCKLASDENWCWKLFCTTCGHMHFRYAFAELAVGKSPDKPGWIVHGRNTNYSNSLGPLPRNYSKEQQEKINNICRNASLASIAKACKFPDWLGYLGLVLEHMYSGEESYKKLSETWASQLSAQVSDESTLRIRLSEIAKGNGLLNIMDLEACETDIMHNKGL
ncbi:MAG: hypothetical protein ACOY3O_00055 [Thermodesulfobacteriota bacterium]